MATYTIKQSFFDKLLAELTAKGEYLREEDVEIDGVFRMSSVFDYHGHIYYVWADGKFDGIYNPVSKLSVKTTAYASGTSD